MSEIDNELQPKYAHLEKHKWKKGESGNPTGRKPRARFCDTLGEALGEPVDETDTQSKTKLRAIVDALIRKCIAGDSKCLTIFVQHADPARTRAAIKAGTLNVLSVHNTDGDGDATDLRADLEEFVASLPGIFRANADGAAPGAIARRVASRPHIGPVRHFEVNNDE